MSTLTRPTYLAVEVAHIPRALKDRAQWGNTASGLGKQGMIWYHWSNLNGVGAVLETPADMTRKVGAPVQIQHTLPFASPQDLPETKYCPQCKTDKPRAAFGKNSNYGNEGAPWCRTCRIIHKTEWAKQRRATANATRANRRKLDPQRPAIVRAEMLRQRYGITPEDYDAILNRQDGRCAVCKKFAADTIMHVDHSHTTGLVRGLLCLNCNAGIGQLQDDPALLRAALAYLEGAPA